MRQTRRAATLATLLSLSLLVACGGLDEGPAEQPGKGDTDSEGAEDCRFNPRCLTTTEICWLCTRGVEVRHTSPVEALGDHETRCPLVCLLDPAPWSDPKEDGWCPGSYEASPHDDCRCWDGQRQEGAWVDGRMGYACE